MLDGARELRQVFREQAGKREAAHSYGVDGEEKEAAVGVQQAATIGDQRWQPVLEPPDFAVRAAAELGRIENDSVIAPAAADLARCELGRIVDQPADRAISQFRELSVLAGLGDRLLAGIDMGD